MSSASRQEPADGGNQAAAGAEPTATGWRARLDGLTRGWKGPMLAALVTLVAALPGLVALPPLDRDEARFAQATAQMLETGDYVNIRFQDQARDKKPVGIHWLQAASVKLVSSAEAREIWAYRLPSLAGGMLAAAACAWGAAAFWGARRGFIAGAVLGASFLLASEAFIAKTDAVLCGAVVLSMAALGRLYGEARGGAPAGRSARTLVWVGQALAVLVKGPIGPMVAILTLAALWLWDRDARWMRRLGWTWGLVFVVAVVGPWAVAITVATDGGFWSSAIAGDLAPKLAGGHETHGGPPGYHLILTPLLIFPATLILPAALMGGWTRRTEPGVRFALAWLVPAWLVFEIVPTKLVHYPLPLYAALAWLAAAACGAPLPHWSRRTGAALTLLAAVAFAAVAAVAAERYGEGPARIWAVLVGVLALAAAAAGTVGLWWRTAEGGLLAALGVGVVAHAALTGGLAPQLKALWTSQRLAEAVDRSGLDPRNGLTPGPVSVTGYSEPSLVFALGATTGLDDPGEAALALGEGRPALVEARKDAAFRAALARRGVKAAPVETVRGYDYSDGDPVAVTLWRPRIAPPEPRVQDPSP